MFIFIEGLPSDVLAIAASGKVTHEDYRNTLIPRAEARPLGARARCFMSSGRISQVLNLSAVG